MNKDARIKENKPNKGLHSRGSIAYNTKPNLKRPRMNFAIFSKG